MKDPLHKILREHSQKSVRGYIAVQGIIQAYDAIANKANVSLLGTVGGGFQGIPVNIALKNYIKIGMNCMIIASETNNPGAAVLIAAW